MTPNLIRIEKVVRYEAYCTMPGCGWSDRVEYNNRDAFQSALEHVQRNHACCQHGFNFHSSCQKCGREVKGALKENGR